MDKNSSVLCMQRSERKFAGFRHLKRVDESNTTPQRLKWLWDHIQLCDEAFDDFGRGKVEYFFMQFQSPEFEFYEVYDDGLVTLSHIVERGTCDLHYINWSRDWGPQKQKPIALELQDYIFFERHVHHAVGFIPANNKFARRFALSCGWKFEGEIRENVLFYGKYYSTHIYGMLDREYINVRARLE